MYIIEPGGTEKVEANPDAIGLKVGIIYDTSREKQEMHFYRFICHNDSVLTVTAMGTEDIDYYGGTVMYFSYLMILNVLICLLKY